MIENKYYDELIELLESTTLDVDILLALAMTEQLHRIGDLLERGAHTPSEPDGAPGPADEGPSPVFSEGTGTRLVQAKRRFSLRVGIWDPVEGDWARNESGSLKKTIPPMGKRIYIQKKQVVEVWTPYVPIDGGRAWEPVQYPGALVLESLAEKV